MSRLLPARPAAAGDGRPAHPQAARRALGARDLDRDRLAGRGPGDLRNEQGRPAGEDRNAGDEPAHGRPRRIALRRRSEAAGRRRRPHQPARTSVESAAAVTAVDGATVRRSSYVPAEITGGIFVAAADPELLATLEGTTASGRFVDRATERYPAIVLGAKAAKRLGIHGVGGLVQVYVSGRLFTVVGILDPLPLVPELDSAALIGYPVAARLFGTDRSPSKVYVRAREGEAQVRAAAALLPSAADPWDPGGSRGQPPLRRARGAGRRRRRLHLALPRARRGRPPGRRDRDRQRDDHLGAGAPLRGRPAAGAGRPPAPHRRPVPRRVVRARDRRRRRRGAARRRRRPAPTPPTKG